jgi:hypothetical protein
MCFVNADPSVRFRTLMHHYGGEAGRLKRGPDAHGKHARSLAPSTMR